MANAVEDGTMDFEPWRCPRCRSELEHAPPRVRCRGCGEAYELIADIPDLRVGAPAWMDCERDRDDARRLDQEFSGGAPEEMVRAVFAARPDWNEGTIAYRTRQVIEYPDRLRSELNGWLRDSTAGDGFLDVGCGAGTVLSAAAAEGRRGLGIDSSLVWLVVARRLIAHYGGTPVLAAAFAEALPLADASVPGVVMLDVIEHVHDPSRCLREADRVLRPGGSVAIATPNRFSLAQEPHVFVWGVGWLPRRWQKRYAEWRSGRAYTSTRLMSVRETGGLLARNTRLKAMFLVPEVPEAEMSHFPPLRARLARAYNRLARVRALKPALLAVGPFFRAVATKRSA